MALKFIFFVSFALTATLFYLSKSEETPRPAKSISGESPATAEPLKASEPKKKKDIKLAEANAPIIESYASLKPGSDIQPVAVKPRHQDFFASMVSPTLRSCYDDLIKRRKEIWKARDRETELSFDGEVELTASFHEGQLNFVRSRSSEIRDEKFHNCLETGMKQWKFPQSIASQPEWTFRKKISYDVTHSYDCTTGTTLLNVSSVATSKCL